VRKADNLPPFYAVVTKSGNLNFLEPSGPVQACNGTALPFTVQTINSYKVSPHLSSFRKQRGYFVSHREHVVVPLENYSAN